MSDTAAKLRIANGYLQVGLFNKTTLIGGFLKRRIELKEFSSTNEILSFYEKCLAREKL